jgi:hypothetical protein
MEGQSIGVAKLRQVRLFKGLLIMRLGQLVMRMHRDFRHFGPDSRIRLCQPISSANLRQILGERRGRKAAKGIATPPNQKPTSSKKQPTPDP